MRFQPARRVSMLAALFLLLIAALALPVFAATKTFDTTTPAAMRLIDSSDATYEGYDIVVSGVTVTINGTHAFASLTVQSGGSVTHAPGLVGGMNLNIAGTVKINSGCYINLTGAGYVAAQGPGAGTSGLSSNDTRGSGGGYGGQGGYGYNGTPPSSNLYGSITQPVSLGSGGGNGQSGATSGGAGGGVLHLTASTINILTGGFIQANGGDSGGRAGGGSGGSLWISTQTLTGQGNITASGGFAYDSGGAGGGGRIALYYNDKSGFAGSILATGNTVQYQYPGSQYGGAGTIYFQQTGAALGDLLIDNGGSSGRITTLPNDITLANLTIQRQAWVVPTGGLLPDGGTVRLTVQQNFTLASNGRLSTQGYGYPAAQGPGAGKNGLSANGTDGSGGSYGGRGGYGYNGTPPTSIYGSVTQPAELGSGGGNGLSGAAVGGAGGGIITLTVNGTLNVGQSCSIDANGGDSQNQAGGGSGGSLWIVAQTLTGQGAISANGGYGNNNGGGGSGGRIALYYNDKSNFAGSILAIGNASQYQSQGTYQNGGAGTLYFQQTGQAIGDLILDNSGLTGQVTPLPSALTLLNTLVVKGRATLVPPGDTFPAGSTLTLTTLGDLTVASDGRITAAGYGYASAQAPAGTNGAGANGGSDTNTRGGGGGYGGKGGAGYTGVPGGMIYGSVTQPTDLGSGGGTGYNGANAGGAGGGAIRLIINGALHLSGVIDANGGDSQNRAGGGSGGSVWITTPGIDGGGGIMANGGFGNDYGGGGGGGRVALYSSDNSKFIGVFQAVGGGSSNQNGANGTANSYAVSSAYSLSSVTITPGAVAGGQTATGIITLSGATPPEGVSVSLTSSDPGNALVPSSVTFAGGQTTATFPITANSKSQPYTVTVTASLGGLLKSGAVVIKPWLGTLTLNPASATSGQTLTATLTLNLPAPSGGLAVSLAASDPALTLPNGGVLTFAAGTTTQNFTVSVGGVSAAKTATLTATYLAESLTASVYLNPAGVQAQSVAVTPGSVVGGNVATGVVTLNGPAPSGGALVALTSSDTATATVPASLLIAAGQTSAAFTIKTTPSATLKSLLISATLGLTQITTLTVRQSGVAALTLLPAAIIGGGNSIGIVTLDSPATAPITVTLSSNQTAAVPVASVVIPVGQTTASFSIATSAVSFQTTALITARANGAAKSQGLNLYPIGTKLSIATISGVISLESCANLAQPMTFILRPTDGSAARTINVTLGADGAFAFSGQLTQKYDVWIKGAKWLAKVVSLDATRGSVSGVTALLNGGDANNDNSVDSSDFTALIGAFNSDITIPGSGYDVNADFNCDGSVDSSDFTILIGNYNSVGAD